MAAQEQHGAVKRREILGPVEIRALPERGQLRVDDRAAAPGGVVIVRIDVRRRDVPESNHSQIVRTLVIGRREGLLEPQRIVEHLAEKAHRSEEVLEIRLGVAPREGTGLAQDRAAHATAVVPVGIDEPRRIHPAPRMADEHERLVGHARVMLDDQPKVLEVQVERVGVRGVPPRQAGAALIPKHDVVAVVGEHAEGKQRAVVRTGSAV